jgi:hypothetical protein
MRGTDRIVSRSMIISLLPLLSTAFYNPLRVLSLQKSQTIKLPTAPSVYSTPRSNNRDDNERQLSNMILGVHSVQQPSTAQEVSERPSSSSSSLQIVSALATMAPIVMMSFFIAIMPLPAMAAAGGAAVIPSALFSWGHLLAQLSMVGTVVAQKLLVQPSMTKDEGCVGMLNIAYSLALALLLASGYFRVVSVKLKAL